MGWAEQAAQMDALALGCVEHDRIGVEQGEQGVHRQFMMLLCV